MSRAVSPSREATHEKTPDKEKVVVEVSTASNTPQPTPSDERDGESHQHTFPDGGRGWLVVSGCLLYSAATVGWGSVQMFVFRYFSALTGHLLRI